MWSRVEALRALDEDMEELDAAMQRFHQLQAKIAHQVSEELAATCELATEIPKSTPRSIPASLPRSFEYFKKLVLATQPKASGDRAHK